MGGPVTTLATVPIFAGLSQETLNALEGSASRRRILAGETLFRQGEAADEMFVVARGRLQVVIDGQDGETVLNELGPGAAVGELALLTGASRSASVHAIRDSELIVLPGSSFARQLTRDPALAAGIARMLASQLQTRGGLPLQESPPTLFVVRGLGTDVPVVAFAGSLAAALEAFGSIVTLSGGTAEDIEAAEARYARVVLLDDGRDQAWSQTCGRQADRTLLVAIAGSVVAGPQPEAELVLLGPFAGEDLRRLLDTVGPRAYHRLASTELSDPGIGRLARRLVRRSLGVVLSGGGARGFAHIGVLEVLEAEGITVDRYGGCSMGALIAAMAAAGWSPAMIRDRCHEELVRRSPFNDYTVPRFALIRSRKAQRMLDRMFGEMTIEELARPLFTVSADLLSSRIVVHRRGSVLEAVGASMSIPGLAAPISRGGRLLVDGGVLNNLPVDAMVETGEGPVLAVDVIRRVTHAGEGEPAVPSIMETLSRATVLGSVERAEANRSLATMVVTPDVQDVPLRDFRALDRAIEAGRRAAAVALEAGGRAALDAATGPLDG